MDVSPADAAGLRRSPAPEAAERAADGSESRSDSTRETRLPHGRGSASNGASPSSEATLVARSDSAPARKPGWLKVPLPGGEDYVRLKALARRLDLHTVCEEARCPNVGECWAGRSATMTLMVLGDTCTRRCRFCAVKTSDTPPAPDPDEPRNVGEAVAELDLGYVVITSVDRDDLPDGGAGHYAACVRAIRECSPRTVVETLVPDYRDTDLATLMDAAPDVLAHNVEVVDRLQRRIRDPRCSFERSLATLTEARELAPDVFTKSSLMLGLGETEAEIEDALVRLRAAQVDFLTLGQYLRPTTNHAPVREYVTPERFAEWRQRGEELGFRYVAAGPLVRSSYKAGEFFAEREVRRRRGTTPRVEGARPSGDAHPLDRQQ